MEFQYRICTFILHFYLGLFAKLNLNSFKVMEFLARSLSNFRAFLNICTEDLRSSKYQTTADDVISDVNFQDSNLLVIFLVITKTIESGQAEAG